MLTRNGLIAFCLAISACGSACWADADSSVDFAAPVVGSKTQLTNVAAGQIVYEQSTNGFWGLTTNGTPQTASNWIQLSNANNVTSSQTSAKIESALLNNGTSSSCAIVSQEGNWIQPTGTRSAAGKCSYTFNSSYFSAAPNCVCSANGTNAIACVTSMSASGVNVFTAAAAGSYMDETNVSIICKGH